MIPTEQEGTAAVDAAARVVWDQQTDGPLAASGPLLDFAALPPLEQNRLREAVLPIVWAALEVLPDRTVAGWDEGYKAGGDEAGECCGCNVIKTPNPYRETP